MLCADMVQVDAERQQRLIYLRNKANDLRTTERQLCLQLAQVRESLSCVCLEEAEITNLSTPVSSLPNEILGEIFRYMKDSYNDDNIPDIVVVSHVTRHWRNVALSNPSLWDTIRLDASDPSMDLPIAFLTRSKPCTLDITLGFPDDAPMSSLRMLSVLIPHFGHIRRLVIQSGDNEHIVEQIVKSLVKFHVPSLERLEISLELGDSQDSALWRERSLIFSSGAPLLSSVALDGISLQCCQPPLAAITHLSLDSDGDATILMPYDYFCDALSACSSLISLELQGRLFAFTLNNTAIRIEIPSLVCFAVGYPIHYRQDHYIRSIFETISAPALQTLNLNYMHRQTLQVAVDFIQSRQLYPMLEHLRLEEPAVECITADFIRATASVTHLTLIYVGGIPRKMAALAPLLRHKHPPATPADALWPRLHTLSVYVFDEVFLRDLITTRIAVGAPLLTLRIESGTYDTLRPDQIAWCQARLKVESVDFDL
jgi:hypothetical protein